MTTTLEQTVSQIQQELLTLRAQIASRTSSCINTNDVGRPKDFSGKEEDFQQWSREIQAFLAGVIKESEMMLDWAADQTMEITTTAIDLEFLPTESNGGPGERNLEFVLQHMYDMLRIRRSQEANDIVANSWKNPLEAWRRLHERYDPIGGGRIRTSSAPSFLWDVALFRNSKRELNAGSPMSRNGCFDTLKLERFELADSARCVYEHSCFQYTVLIKCSICSCPR